MNFQVGDVVVDLSALQFWNNVYHHDKTVKVMRKQTIASANEKYFTCDPKIDLAKVNGFMDYTDQARVFHQKNGLPYDGHSQMVNLTRNRANLMAHLEKEFQKGFQKCDEEDTKEIAALESSIRALQAKIDKVKAGKRPLSFKQDTVERDFLHASRAAIIANLQ